MNDRRHSKSLARHKLPTNATSIHHPVQRWASFVAGFSLEFVHRALEPLEPQSMVLDPFVGTGTTAVGARDLGHHAVGYDAHPLFATLAQCKVRTYGSKHVAVVSEALRCGGTPRTLSESAEKFLRKMFDREELDAVLAASANVDATEPYVRPLAVAMLLLAAEKACGSKTDGIYKAPTSRKSSIPFKDALDTVAQMIDDDVRSATYKQWAGSATIHQASSTRMTAVPDKSIDAVVTSPPYLNNFDFAEMTRMQLYLLGWAASWGEITEKVRTTQITNTTTALRGKKSSEFQGASRDLTPASLHSHLDPLVAALSEQRKTRKGKKDYDYLVYPYYSQINSVIRELYRVMRSAAKVHWIVSDAALYGMYIATQDHTASLMREAGFRNVQVELLRKRGHRWKLKKRDGAPGRLGEYHITAER